MFICFYMYVCPLVYIGTNIETDTKTNIGISVQTYRHANVQTYERIDM
jgi:hypothetical protein